MATLTNEQRSAIMSARAKNRKAATVLVAGDVTVPANVAKAMKLVETWATKAIAPAAKAKKAA